MKSKKKRSSLIFRPLICPKSGTDEGQGRKKIWSKTWRDNLNSSGPGYDVPPEPLLVGPDSAYGRYVPPMPRVNIRLLWMKQMMLFYEYQLLNLQSLWGILTHMLEQTQIRGRVWSENMESLDWMRTEGIYCSSVVATDSASWIPFSSTERFTSIHGIDQVWIKIFDRFLHSFVRFVFWCAGRSSEARCWIVNWSPSGSMFLTTFETSAKEEIQQIVCDQPDQMGGFGGQRSKKTVCIQYIV